MATTITTSPLFGQKKAQFDLFSQDAARPAAAAVLEGVEAPHNETLGALLSPSQANCYLNCSAKWWYKYGAQLPDPKGGSFTRGIAVDKVIERWFRLVLDGETPEVDGMAEVCEDAWEGAAADASFTAADDIEALKLSGARLVRMYLEQAAPEIQPADLQVQVAGEIAGVPVRGFIDLVDVDGTIIDFKTAGKTPSGIGSDYALQLATYTALLPGANGKARIDTMVDNKVPKLVKIEYQVTAADAALATNLYPRVREGIREGLYLPNRNSNLCSRKYCNFADACCGEFGGSVD